MLHQISNLKERVEDSIFSGQAGVWIRSHEPEEAFLTIHALAKEYNPDWLLYVWDACDGLQFPGKSSASQQQSAGPFSQQPQSESSIAAVETLLSVARERAGREANEAATEEDQRFYVLVLRNAHRELQSSQMITAVQHLLNLGKSHRCHLVALSFPGVELPLELREQFWVFDHELPDKESLGELLDEQLQQSFEEEDIDNEGVESQLPDEEQRERIVMAAKGLTRSQAEGAYSLSLRNHGQVVPEYLWQIKADTLNKRGLLRLSQETCRFDSFVDKDGEYVPGIGGLTAIKEFSRKALEPGKHPRARARAMLLLGIPGAGKSQFAKALGNETGRPTLMLDVGALMGSLVGQTEERTREALAIVDAMEPSILMVDEIDKALSGVGGDNDSGVTTRLFGALLTWLNDHKSDTLFIASANDISKLPPEFTRAERFDGIFFMDLPTKNQRSAIWDIYLDYYDVSSGQERPDDSKWTGAEIKACCRTSEMLNIPLVEAAHNVVPVVNTARESIEKLRSWADNRCLDAELGGVYTIARQRKAAGPSDSSQRMKRRVKRK